MPCVRVLSLILTFSICNVRADYEPSLLSLSSLLSASHYVAIATVTKAELGKQICPTNILATLSIHQLLKGDHKPPFGQINLSSSPCMYIDLELHVPVGCTVLAVYSVREGRAGGLIFSMEKEGDLGFKVKSYLDFLNIKDAAQKSEAFFAFAKTELNRQFTHPALLASIAIDIKAGLSGASFDKEFEAGLLKQASNQKNHLAETYCRLLEYFQSKHTVDAYVALVQKSSDPIATLHDIVAKYPKVREAALARSLLEKDERRLELQLLLFATVEDVAWKENLKELWKKNDSSRKPITNYLKHCNRPKAGLQEELQKLQ